MLPRDKILQDYKRLVSSKLFYKLDIERCQGDTVDREVSTISEPSRAGETSCG